MYYEGGGAKTFLISFFTSLVVSSAVTVLLVLFVLPNMDLSVSGGGGRVEVPNLQGVDVSQAKFVLENKGLILQVVGEEESEYVPKGKIVRQEPIPGVQLERGRVVSVWVSKGGSPGDEKVEVPSLEGLSLNAARVPLEDAGLRLGW